MGAELIWKEPVYAKAVEALLAPLTADAFTHAEGILAGKTHFRNTLSKVLSAQAKACRDELAKNPRMKGAAVLLKITTGLNRDEVLEFAWRRFVGRLWRRTLGGVSRELGYERGGGLSDATSPQDILRYFWRDEEPVEDPMKKEMVVTSNLRSRSTGRCGVGAVGR